MPASLSFTVPLNDGGPALYGQPPSGPGNLAPMRRDVWGDVIKTGWEGR